jgi:hypothetical protein
MATGATDAFAKKPVDVLASGLGESRLVEALG